MTEIAKISTELYVEVTEIIKTMYAAALDRISYNRKNSTAYGQFIINRSVVQSFSAAVVPEDASKLRSPPDGYSSVLVATDLEIWGSAELVY